VRPNIRCVLQPKATEVIAPSPLSKCSCVSAPTFHPKPTGTPVSPVAIPLASTIATVSRFVNVFRSPMETCESNPYHVTGRTERTFGPVSVTDAVHGGGTEASRLKTVSIPVAAVQPGPVVSMRRASVSFGMVREIVCPCSLICPCGSKM
jgi:hypothetical protein